MTNTPTTTQDSKEIHEHRHVLETLGIQYTETNGQLFVSTKELFNVMQAFSEKNTITALITKFTFNSITLEDIKLIIDRHRK